MGEAEITVLYDDECPFCTRDPPSAVRPPRGRRLSMVCTKPPAVDRARVRLPGGISRERALTRTCHHLALLLYTEQYVGHVALVDFAHVLDRFGLLDLE